MPAAPIAPGTLIEGARIELDADTLFVASLKVQHASSGFGPGANKGLRLGCAFGAMDGAPQRALQRYIDLTQRREKFLTLD